MRKKETDEKFEARGSSIDGMLFRADVVNNGRYRYVIPSFKDDEKSSCAVHKNITDVLFITVEGGLNGSSQSYEKNKTLSKWEYCSEH